MGVNMSWLKWLVFGFISGLAEFLPISAPAHQTILSSLFGFDNIGSLTKLLVHMAALLALLISFRKHLAALHRDLRLATIPKRRRRRQPNEVNMLDIQLVRTAFFPMLLGFFFYPKTRMWAGKLYLIALFLLMNGIILLIPELLAKGNKDSRTMTRLDGVFLGLCSGLSVIPGISRMAMGMSAASIRGADRRNALTWVFMLSIPALAFLIGFDIYEIATVGVSLGAEAIVSIIAALGAYLGAFFGVRLMELLSKNAGISGFIYYSWGAALFTFILYLTIR